MLFLFWRDTITESRYKLFRCNSEDNCNDVMFCFLIKKSVPLTFKKTNVYRGDIGVLLTYIAYVFNSDRTFKIPFVFFFSFSAARQWHFSKPDPIVYASDSSSGCLLQRVDRIRPLHSASTLHNINTINNWFEQFPSLSDFCMTKKINNNNKIKINTKKKMPYTCM